MGFAKHVGAVKDGQIEQAKVILTEAGCIEECEDHGYFVNTDEDIKEAYRLGSIWMKNGDPRVSSFDKDHRLMTDTIKATLEDTGDHCPGCASRDRD